MSTELAMLSSYIALTIWTFVGKVMSLLFKESSKSGKKSLEILLSVVLYMYFNPYNRHLLLILHQGKISMIFPWALSLTFMPPFLTYLYVEHTTLRKCPLNFMQSKKTERIPASGDRILDYQMLLVQGPCSHFFF